MGFKNSRNLVGFLTFLCLLSPISSQSPIPAKQDGFWYRQKKGKDEPVLIEAFFDPVCPDSRDSWPPLKKAIQQYGSRVSVVVHTFPLPSTYDQIRSIRASSSLGLCYTIIKVNAITQHGLTLVGQRVFSDDLRLP
ncbi:UNVERIFIED_CONTAM: hypothetical protein Sangu_2297800 [Sesamum angustifolium]|uniref:Thioredoxin superfamily protein n=1 Tax=Sesamum angustifolium TaxID=2727405 RepID=A0AAW2L5S8_9LAMI